MTIHTFWIFAFCLLAVAILTESFLSEYKTYVRDALTQNAFVLKTWKCRVFPSAVLVSMGNEHSLEAIFDGDSVMVQQNRLLIKYNYREEEVSVLLKNVTRGDEGLYTIYSFIVPEGAHMRKIWNVQLNVLEPGEIKQCYAGENIMITEFVQKSIFFPRLYHNDQLIAVLRGSDCDLNTSSPFYGRIRCSKDKDSFKTTIELKNVTENDTGLYKVETEGILTQRCFLNITGTYTKSASALINVTPPERCDENNSDQTRNITLPATVLSSTAVNRAHSLSVPVYVIPVIIGAFGIINLIGCLIWSQRRKIHMTKAEQLIPHDECDPGLYLTPISSEPPLAVPTCQEEKTGHSNIAQNTNIDPCKRSIHMAQMLTEDGYEVVYFSNIDDPEITPELDEITDESTENCNTRYSDTSGYLTVLGRRETTV